LAWVAKELINGRKDVEYKSNGKASTQTLGVGYMNHIFPIQLH